MTRGHLVFTVPLLSLAGCEGEPVVPGVEAATGLDLLVRENFSSLAGRRIGVVTNQTGVDARLRHIADLISSAGDVRLVALFAPEHGVRGMAEAGSAVGDETDPATGVPVYSLYGERRRPSASQLEGIDLLLYDIQDIGVRTYTYLATLVRVLEAAAAAGIEVRVLDRPNPLGGARREGPLLERSLESFVGPHPIPLRTGLTVGEFALLVNREREIGARLNVLPLSGWRRDGPVRSSPGRPWVAPSPNIPTPLTALVYAGFVLIEGTNLSEGRGTTRPFQLFGAPWLDARATVARLEERRLPGVRFRATGFVPSFSKYRGESCQGVEVHVTDAEAFRPVLTAVAAIADVRRLHSDAFRFRTGIFDRLSGTARLREAIEGGDDPRTIAASWEKDLEAFEKRVEPFLLYP